MSVVNVLQSNHIQKQTGCETNAKKQEQLLTPSSHGSVVIYLQGCVRLTCAVINKPISLFCENLESLPVTPLQL